jgi:hypothetical protein
MPVSKPEKQERFGRGQSSTSDTEEAASVIDRTIRDLIAASRKKSRLSCPQIADRMSLRLGRNITGGMIYDFSAGSKKGARFPASFVSAFCDVTGDDRLRMYLVGDRLAKLVELGEQLVESMKTERRRKRLLGQLSKVSKKNGDEHA